MAASIRSAVTRAGVTPAETARVAEAFAAAMAPRVRTLADDHHPAYLHPGRSVLILTRDLDESDASALAAAALLESRDPELALDPADIVGLLGEAGARALADVPKPGATDLAERLLALEPWLQRAALSERLDHLRHEHLREPAMPWTEVLDETRRVWLPLAERAAPGLVRRYLHWARTFVRKT